MGTPNPPGLTAVSMRKFLLKAQGCSSLRGGGSSGAPELAPGVFGSLFWPPLRVRDQPETGQVKQTPERVR